MLQPNARGLRRPHLCLLSLCTVALLLGGPACSKERKNPFDQSRCDPRCSGGQVCYDGQCVWPDGGSRDGSPADALDAAPDAGTPVAGSWVDVPRGDFVMGSPADEACREPDSAKESQHEVTLTHDFAIFSTEVTQQAFTTLRGYNPSHRAGCETCPVEMVSWHEAAAYCDELSAQEGIRGCYSCTGSGSAVSCAARAAYADTQITSCPGYRLPTEAEWELAYRAGTTTALCNGALGSCTGPDAKVEVVAWYLANAGNTTHPVGTRQPNAWGLYDLAGNVAEWVHDGYAADLGAGQAIDPAGSTSGAERVVRGGGFDAEPSALRAAARQQAAPGQRSKARGFRCVRTISRWRAAAPLGTARRLHTASLLSDGTVLVAGGQDENNARLPSAELFDPQTGTWAATGAMTTERASHSAVVLADGRVLVAGGYRAGLTPGSTHSTEIYDPATGQWTETGPLKISRYGHALVTLKNGKVLAAGGYSDYEGEYQASAELYDPALGQWADTGSEPTARHKAFWALLPDGKVLHAGGHDGKGMVDTAVLYDSASGQWTATGAMGTSRGAALGRTNTTLLLDGRVLIAGRDGGNATADSALIYEPSKGSWSSAAAMTVGRGGAAYALLPDGRVLVSGGAGANGAELYDPLANTWRTTTTLQVRQSHTLTILPNGSALACGGGPPESGPSSLASCELYR